jgi:hypothetical protein
VTERLTYVELESYHLAQYSAQIPCYLCGGANAYDAELCRHCSAPMALAHQADVQKILPQLIAALAAPGVGKTVYLGMLMDMLSRGQTAMQMLARGAFSISLQQATVAALARGEFPDPTPADPERWNWVHCQLTTPERRQPVELILPDVAGAALAEELDHPNTLPVVRCLMRDAAGLVLLIDAEQVEHGNNEQTFFALKVLTYLCEVDGDPRLGWPARPVSVVFTKADQAESCFDDPALYAARRLPGLVQQCRERFQRVKFFASGVAGAIGCRRLRNGARVEFPLRVEPRGLIEPFAWLVKEL